MTESDQTTQPTLEIGQIIPAFTLPGTDGMPHSPWDYKQREHLLLLFIPIPNNQENQALLTSFAQQYTQFRQERCSLLAITTQPVISNLALQEKLHLPFPLIADTQIHIFPRYTRPHSAGTTTTPSFYPAIVLADLYNALYQQWIAALPTIDELLQTLQYLNNICAL